MLGRGRRTWQKTHKHFNVESEGSMLVETRSAAQHVSSGFTEAVMAFGVEWKLHLAFSVLIALEVVCGDSSVAKLCFTKEIGDTLESIDKSCYFGDMFHAGLQVVTRKRHQ